MYHLVKDGILYPDDFQRGPHGEILFDLSEALKDYLFYRMVGRKKAMIKDPCHYSDEDDLDEAVDLDATADDLNEILKECGFDLTL